MEPSKKKIKREFLGPIILRVNGDVAWVIASFLNNSDITKLALVSTETQRKYTDFKTWLISKLLYLSPQRTQIHKCFWDITTDDLSLLRRPGLTHLQFGSEFNQPWVVGALPTGLIDLILDKNYDMPLVEGVCPVGWISF